ncbi:DNA polymerase [Anaerotignum sp.]|uniref:DNA polymerase n=1 Tax=Anaerotignum sp. TaxID=2039241 RepID=UPI00332DE731
MRGHISVDIETFSSVDITKSGLYKYVQSPDFSILLLAYSIDGGAVEIIDLTKTELPIFIQNLLLDPSYIKHAYNAAFEWYCLSKYFGLEEKERTEWLKQWRCTMMHGLYCGYTAGLEATGKAIGLPQDKQKLTTGKALIKTFCSPCKPTKSNGNRTRTLPSHEPERWVLFKEYCKQDVVTEMEIENRLSSFPVPDMVQDQWVLDQIQNERGVAIDLGLIEGALYCDSVASEKATNAAKAITALENPNSVAQLKKWIQDRTGIEVPGLTKETVDEMLDTEIPVAVRKVLELRQQMGKTSVKKYMAMTQAECADGRLRGMLQFYGANRTGRWAGRLVQVQNLPRTYLHGSDLDLARKLVKLKNPNAIQLTFGSVQDTLSQLVRTAFIPEKGKVFVDADFSAIEARVVAWLAGENWVLEVFRTHGKIYEATAAQMFGVPIERIAKGNPEYELRQKGKVATLALGYNGGPGALINMGALKMGIPEEELPDIVSKWRGANQAIVRCWRALEHAAIQAIKSGRAVGTHGLVFAREADITKGQDFLTILLPSGRKLFYAKPHLTLNQWGNESIGYYGMNQTSKKWEPVETYGGKLTENVVQAIARDCLAHTLTALESQGYKIVFHVHDEVIIEIEKEKADLEKVCQLMSQPIPFAPGLPMAADGWVGDYFTKD